MFTVQFSKPKASQGWNFKKMPGYLALHQAQDHLSCGHWFLALPLTVLRAIGRLVCSSLASLTLSYLTLVLMSSSSPCLEVSK